MKKPYESVYIEVPGGRSARAAGNITCNGDVKGVQRGCKEDAMTMHKANVNGDKLSWHDHEYNTGNR